MIASTAALGRGATRQASIVQFDYPGTIPVFARLDPADLRAVSRLADAGRLTPRSAALHLAQREAGLAAISHAQRHHRIRRRPASRPDASHRR